MPKPNSPAVITTMAGLTPVLAACPRTGAAPRLADGQIRSARARAPAGRPGRLMTAVTDAESLPAPAGVGRGPYSG